MTKGTDVKDKSLGLSVSACAAYAGVLCAVFGGVIAVLVHYRVRDPFWMGVAFMVLAVVGFAALGVLRFVVKKYRRLSVMLAAACWTLTFWSLIDSVIVPLVRESSGAPFMAVVRSVFGRWPVMVFLAASLFLAAVLLSPKKSPSAP